MSGIRNSSEFNDPDGEYLDDAEAEYDASYLVPQASLTEYSMRLIDGDKAGSRWLVVGDNYIYHKNDGSLDEGHTYWECSKRRQSR